MKSFQDVTGRSLKLGLLVNPYAGVGGPLALKGSDILSDSLKNSVQVTVSKHEGHAHQRLMVCLQALRALPGSARIQWHCAPGVMGAGLPELAGWPAESVSMVASGSQSLPTCAEDTVQAARALREQGIDLLLFAGGDGTARDICAALGDSLPVLGVPAGVKMHSGVFAINPAAAAALLGELLAGHWVSLDLAEVRDIDETEVRAGRVRARHYGEMRVPVAARYLQQVKCSGREVEALVLEEIAAGISESLVPGRTYALGPGTTVAAVMSALGLPNTLLGFDLVRDGELLAADVDAAGLLSAAEADADLTVVITPTGGQGSLIGRGNQQLSPALLQRIGRGRILVLSTHDKLDALAGRPLRLDTGNAQLDVDWSGLWPVHTGYQQQVLYAVSG